LSLDRGAFTLIVWTVILLSFVDLVLVVMYGLATVIHTKRIAHFYYLLDKATCFFTRRLKS
jgi:hypothetical protein